MTSVTQGGFYLVHRDNPNLATYVIGLLAVLGGSSLLIGFLTPVVAAILGLGAAGMASSWFPSVNHNLFDAALPALLVVIIAAAVFFLGPGALSIDARLFGRREIIIPQTSRSTKL